eukprot:scaffold3944_cov132-Skeletonema_menzelii.AAC.2
MCGRFSVLADVASSPCTSQIWVSCTLVQITNVYTGPRDDGKGTNWRRKGTAIKVGEDDSSVEGVNRVDRCVG